MKINSFLFLAFLSAVFTAKGAVKLPALISDNMVLQQNTKVKIWGESEENKIISVIPSWNEKKYITSASGNGQWITEIETPQAGGPFTITISDGEAVLLKNILVGEVWFCSGQSNMEMPLEGFMGQPVNNAQDAVSQAKSTDHIRFFKVERAFNNKAEKECKGKWLDSSPATLPGFSAAAYFFAKKLQASLNIPVAIIVSSWGGSQIEPWMDDKTLREQFPEVSLAVLNKDIKEVKNPRPEPVLIYNSMVHPVLNYGIRGFLWYQGESNRLKPELYRKLFPAMVKSWREKWQSDNLPFYYVQIAPFNYDHPDSLEAADLRQAQLDCLKDIPNSGMVVTADIGHPTCIHPPQKDVVGNRLALLALAKTYHQNGIPFSGPTYKAAKADNGKIIVEFNFATRGLHTTDTLIEGFELAGPDKRFYPAKASLAGNATMVQLESKDVRSVQYVRYAYRNYAPVSLFNNWQLPLTPFLAEIR